MPQKLKAYANSMWYSVIDANQHLYVTSTEAYKEGKEARLERRRAERQDQERDDASKE